MINNNKGIIIVQTPFRISFFGGGTDFPDYFNKSGGQVLCATINQYLYVTLNSLELFYEKRIRLSYSKFENVDNPEDLEHEIARVILLNHPYMEENRFLDIHTFSDLPAASGVGSSSSFTVGMLKAMHSLSGVYKMPKELAKEAIFIERSELKDVGGWQDQICAAYGGLNKIYFLNDDFYVHPVPLEISKKRAIEDSLLCIFTGGSRSSSNVQKHLGSADQISKENALNKLYGFVDDGFDILLNSSPEEKMIHEFGSLMHKAWLVKKSLSSAISNAQIDSMYNQAIKAGALGGKLCGAGGAGFLLLVVPKESRNSVIQSFRGYKIFNLKFDDMGSKIIHSSTYQVEASNIEASV